MKNIWTKVPAWIKAILLNLILLFPTSIGIQYFVQYSLRSGASWGWGLLPIIAMLAVYWFLTKRLNPYREQRHVEHSFHINLKDKKVWIQFAGLFLLTAFLIQLFVLLFPSENNLQLQTFIAFRALPAPIALPLLLGLAMMAGVVEEVTYRGYMQNATSVYPKWLSFLLVALLFSIVHRLPFQLFIPYVIVSMAYSLVADQQKSLGLVMISHIVIDFVIFVGIYQDWFNITEVTPRALICSALGAMVGAFLLVRELKLSELLQAKNSAHTEAVASS